MLREMCTHLSYIHNRRLMYIHDEFTNDIYRGDRGHMEVWISIRDPLNIHRGDRGHMEVWRLYRPPMDVMFRVGII